MEIHGGLGDPVDAFAIVASPTDVARSIEERFGELITQFSFIPPASLDEGEVAPDHLLAPRHPA